MAATVRISYYGGSASEPAGVDAEGGVKFNREDSLTGTSAPIPIPTTTGTNFSWIKQLALEVTSGDSTTISNRKVFLSGTPTAGLKLHFKGASAYDQADADNMPEASGSDGATPSGYTPLTTSPQSYHDNAVSASSTGRNGDFCVLVLGVDSTYSGGAGSNIALPDLKISYDEA